MENNTPQGMPPQDNPAQSLQVISYNTVQHSRLHSHRKLIVGFGISIVGVLIVLGIVVAIFISKKPVVHPAVTSKGVPANNQPTQPNNSSTTSTATKQTASAPSVKPHTSQPVASIQQTPQLPVNNQSSQPYVGSLPSSVAVFTSGPFNFYYAGARQFVTATGAAATFSQTQPSVPEQPSAENHSLIELSVSSADGKQIVEVGWVVDKTMNGDDLPHLFVYHWVNGQTSCYNGCGFVQTSQTAPGSAVAVGTTGDYEINYSTGNWNIYYNGSNIGYFPGSLWSGSFTQISFVQVFGEVAISTSSTTRCIQMGNGIAGSAPGSAKISNFTLVNSSTPTALSPYATSPSTYSYGSASAIGLTIGGPGAC